MPDLRASETRTSSWERRERVFILVRSSSRPVWRVSKVLSAFTTIDNTNQTPRERELIAPSCPLTSEHKHGMHRQIWYKARWLQHSESCHQPQKEVLCLSRLSHQIKWSQFPRRWASQYGNPQTIGSLVPAWLTFGAVLHNKDIFLSNIAQWTPMEASPLDTSMRLTSRPTDVTRKNVSWQSQMSLLAKTYLGPRDRSSLNFFNLIFFSSLLTQLGSNNP